MKWSLLYLISEWVIRLGMLVYVPQRRPPAAARTWLLFIFLLPWPGLLLYILFGRIYLPARRKALQERASRFIRQAQAQIGSRITSEPPLPANLAPIPEIARRLGDFAPLGGNAIEILTDYAGATDRLIADIDSAQHHVHLLFYIYEPDQTGERVTQALIGAAARGVQCRVLLDAFGAKRGLHRLGPAMRAAGIETVAVLPVGLFRRKAARFDLRNHRKIVVIDGHIGYIGSQNIVNPGFVKDHPNEELVVRLTGPAVAQLQAAFLADRYFETEDVLESPDLFPKPVPVGNSEVQLVPSGPGYGRENGRDLIISLLYGARERITITTPYFVPDEPFLQAIRAARLNRGAAVHLILSLHANQLITQQAQRSYFDDLLDAGVKIHLYKPRFLHAKYLTIDRDLAMVGSTNMDIRSFALNAEINLLIYDREAIEKICALQEQCIERSIPVLPEEWERRLLIAKVIQNTSRLMDSFL
jgi:cardiolipin synthase A/B